MADCILPLNEVAHNAKVIVHAIEGGNGVHTQAEELGLKVGVSVRVLRNEAGPLVIETDAGSHTIGLGLAAKILVTAPDDACKGRPLALSDLVTGDRARIIRIKQGGPFGIRRRLLDMGITRGTEVRVERHAPLGDPVEISIKGYHLALRMNEARQIEVERL